MAWMQRNGDDGTAGEERWLTRLTGGMRKRKRESETICWSSYLPSAPHVSHPSDRLLVYFQPAHITSSPQHVTLLSLSLVFYLLSPFPISLFLLPFPILSLNGELCEQAMQMRWLLPHCSSSRAEETLIG